MSWDLFLMEILLKKIFVGPVNSVWDPPESTEMHFSIKNKKGVKHKNARCRLYKCPFG